MAVGLGAYVYTGKSRIRRKIRDKKKQKKLGEFFGMTTQYHQQFGNIFILINLFQPK